MIFFNLYILPGVCIMSWPESHSTSDRYMRPPHNVIQYTQWFSTRRVVCLHQAIARIPQCA